MINGIQSQGVGTSMKHICANNQEFDRLRVDVIVDERSLREIYLKGYEMAIKEAQPWAVMCAYNKLNGTYCSEHKELWNAILRGEWGFEGIVMTDWGATCDRVSGIIAGVNLEMPGSCGAYDSSVKRAVKKDIIDTQIFDELVTQNVCLSLLCMEGFKRNTKVDLDKHHELAREAAMQSAVLLKNNDNILPLRLNKSFAVIGEFAKIPRYQGMGSSRVLPYKLDCAFAKFSEYTERVSYAKGFDHRNDGQHINHKLINQAVEAAKFADIAIIFCGLPGICESEGFDRPDIEMPPQHNALIYAVCAANPNTIVVLSNGSAVAMPWVDMPMAIIEGYLSGQASGSAMVDLLFGKESPCGKLAETFPLSIQDVPSHKWFPGRDNQVQYREGLNVGYRYYDTAKVPVLFPFGHGLSYTTFQYGALSLTPTAGAVDSESNGDINVRVDIDIFNSGKVAAAEILQLYVHAYCGISTVYRPEQELKGFQKVFLKPGESKSVVWYLGKEAFEFYCVVDKNWVMKEGEFEIRIGSSSRDIRVQQSLHVGLRCDNYFDPVVTLPVERARVAYPRPHFVNLCFEVDDRAFSSMLGKNVECITPVEERGSAFDRSTILTELHPSFLGRAVVFFVMQCTRRRMQSDKEDEMAANDRVMKAMVGQITLRGLVIYSEGRLGFSGLDILIAILNHRYLYATKLCFKYFRGKGSHRHNTVDTADSVN